LLPLGREADPSLNGAAYDCCAAEREQAPSPQRPSSTCCKNANSPCTYPRCTRQICTVTIRQRSRASFSN